MVSDAAVKLMFFGGVGPLEILLIILIALILFGPKRLPELARAMGEAVNEFRRATSGETKEEKEIKELPKKETDLRELAKSLGIDTAGKTDEEIMEEIKRLAKKE